MNKYDIENAKNFYKKYSEEFTLFFMFAIIILVIIK